MFFRTIKYGIYIVYMRLKGIKRYYIFKTKGEEAAWKYGQDVFYRWSKFTIDMIGIDLIIEGRENIPKEKCVFMGNHQSILDIPILRYSVERELDLVAKKELLKVPIVGYWIRNLRSVAIDRENPREGIKAINKAIENVNRGCNFAIFPEGTRSKDGNILEFKKGSFKIATKAKVPIVPFAIDGAANCFENNKWFKDGRVVIKFGEAINTIDLDRNREKNISKDVYEVVKGMFEDIQ